MPTTGTSPTRPITSWPTWPMAVDCGKCGIFLYGMRVAFPNSSANAPSPEPRTSAILGRSLVFDRINFAARVACSNSTDPDLVFAAMGLRENPDDRSRDQVRHRSSQHCADTEFSQLTALLRRERANTADLNPDRTEVRESAKSECGNREAARIERGLDLPELCERHEFVQHHASAEQISDRSRIVPRNSDQPGDR